MWVTKLLISPVKIRIFCPKTTKFGPKLAFLPGLAGSFGALLVGWLVVGARAVSRKTPIYFINNDNDDDFDIVAMVANDVPKCTYITKTLVRCSLSVFSNTPRKRPSWPDHKIAMPAGAKIW